MAQPVYKIIEINGTSKTDIEAAIQNAISRVSETVRNLRWFEVMQARGLIEKDRIAEWQVTLKIGFNVDSQHVETKQYEEKKEKAAPAPKQTIEQQPSPQGASKFRCKVCGYIYDPQKGDPSQGIKPGTPFEELPDSWQCPECGVNKDQFEKIN